MPYIQIEQPNTSWQKYGLMYPSYAETQIQVLVEPDWLGTDTGKIDEHYLALVGICHELVTRWLDDHPEDAMKWRQPGYRYYDILEKAAPWLSKKIDEYNEKRKEVE